MWVWPVSIHAHPEGRDKGRPRRMKPIRLFQSTRPRRGAISQGLQEAQELNGCQSTRPRRGAMRGRFTPKEILPSFNPRAPGGARLAGPDRAVQRDRVSIHAPPEGRDSICSGGHLPVIKFQSTRPRRGAISLPRKCLVPGSSSLFQSTRPRRGAMVRSVFGSRFVQVSIHAPPEGRDLEDRNRFVFFGGFNPRAPGGARFAWTTRGFFNYN